MINGVRWLSPDTRNTEGQGVEDGEAEHPRRIRSSRVGPAKENPKIATKAGRGSGKSSPVRCVRPNSVQGRGEA